MANQNIFLCETRRDVEPGFPFASYYYKFTMEEIIFSNNERQII